MSRPKLQLKYSQDDNQRIGHNKFINGHIQGGPII